MIKEEENFQLLDVREDWERAQVRITSSIHKPLGELINSSATFPNEYLDSEIDLVIYCKAGVRSRMACESVENNWFSRLYNLSGSMDDWKRIFSRVVPK